MLISMQEDRAAAIRRPGWPSDGGRPPRRRRGRRVERTLLLGWNDGAPTILRDLDAAAPAGSTALVVAAAAFGSEVAAVQPLLGRLALTHRIGCPTDPRVLAAIDASAFDHVIALESAEPARAAGPVGEGPVEGGAEGEAAPGQAVVGRTVISLIDLPALADEDCPDDPGPRTRSVGEALARMTQRPDVAAVFSGRLDADE